MNLRAKKSLAAKSMRVGKNRIKFNVDNLAEIKEAITKEDFKELYKQGIIMIKPVHGRKKIRKTKSRRGPGKIKIKVKKRKENYVKITRKLRRCLKELVKKGEIERELYYGLRKKIKMKNFKSKANMREYIESLKKIKETKEKDTTKNKIKNIRKKSKEESK